MLVKRVAIERTLLHRQMNVVLGRCVALSVFRHWPERQTSEQQASAAQQRCRRRCVATTNAACHKRALLSKLARIIAVVAMR